MTNFNKQWYTPHYVLTRYQTVVNAVGYDSVEKQAKYQRVRDARSVAYFALVQSRIKSKPTFLRLPKNDPPDAYLMQPDSPHMDTAPVECTDYRPVASETLLEQLIRSKKLSTKYSKDYCLLINIAENIDGSYQSVHDFAQGQNVPFTIASLQIIQWAPDTIVRTVLFHPLYLQEHVINVGEEAYHFNQRYGVQNVVTSRRAGTVEKVRMEVSGTTVDTAPWDNLED